MHYCRYSMPRLSQMCHFYTKSLLPTSTVCSDWPNDTVHCDWRNTTSTCRKCNAPYHNKQASFFKINVNTVNNALSFTISSSPKEEQSHVTDTVMKLVCVCTQAAIRTADFTVMWPCLSLSHTHTHTHTRAHTQTHKTCTVNSKYLN